MDFGISLTGHAPVMDEADLAHHAEANGFNHVWVWDNQILGQDAFVIMSMVAAATSEVRIGTCVTNPVTRDQTVLAGAFATLNNITGGRMICGIGRGDSAVRMRKDRPSNLAELRSASVLIREMAAGRPMAINDSDIRLTWAAGHELPVYIAAYGPKALALAGAIADGVILQVADPAVVEWSLGFVREGAASAGRDFERIRVQCAAPLVIGEDLTAARDLVRWYPAVVANHVADLLKRHRPEHLPAELVTYVDGRPSYDYSDHTRPGADHADYVPDEIVDRFTVIGSASRCIERIHELAEIGVTEFNVYAKTDDNKALVSAIGEDLIAAFAR